MASADLDTRTENDPTSNGERRTRIAWDSSVRATPLGHGWNAEPLVVDWFEPGHPDLLVTAGGGARERTARVIAACPRKRGRAAAMIQASWFPDSKDFARSV